MSAPWPATDFNAFRTKFTPGPLCVRSASRPFAAFEALRGGAQEETLRRIERHAARPSRQRAVVGGWTTTTRRLISWQAAMRLFHSHISDQGLWRALSFDLPLRHAAQGREEDRMDPFQMVVLIVAISVGAGVYQTYLKTRANSASDVTTQADLAAMRDEVSRLKERVRVLEAIVTDRDHALAEEIRKLG